MNSMPKTTTDANLENVSNVANTDRVLQDHFQKMLSNIRDALALSRKMEKVLEAVHQKMLNRNIASLEVSLEHQVRLLNMLQMNGSLREHYLKQFGFSNDSTGIKQFFSLMKQQPAIAPIEAYQTLEKYWDQLEHSANRCQQVNNANGRLLARLSASTRKIIELSFSGQPIATYDEHGVPVNPLAE
ncbi:flagellar protein FlgN [Endozoicomonas ascidiicola]|uniref:flagellar protein FlgN n=1 Tax=Endozoicomonas ascidiicola TaxID=1698521 RepID=UPI000BA40B50|nr:flagellar protein FlgN [Endozoicomonas ascidiicola]